MDAVAVEGALKQVVRQTTCETDLLMVSRKRSLLYSWGEEGLLIAITAACPYLSYVSSCFSKGVVVIHD